MLQQQSGCFRNALERVCFPGSGLYACYGNIYCQVLQEDETYDSGKGVEQIGVVFGSGGLKHCGFTGLSDEDAAGTKGDNGQVSVTKLVTYSRG